MKIQSLSVCVPGWKCINNCEFCVTHMHTDTYENFIETSQKKFLDEYIKRLNFARDNGCNTVLLTGQVEPQQNIGFLKQFGMMNQSLDKPFRNIEIQTTGAGVDMTMLNLFESIGISTISLSISSFDDELNNKIIRTPKKKEISLEKLCNNIKTHNFNLRLSLNISKNIVSPAHVNPDISLIFSKCKHLNADQITFRKLYSSDSNTSQDKWIKANSLLFPGDWFKSLEEYIKNKGIYLDKLETGNPRYSVNDMSVVIDKDCMSKEESDSYKYFILRPNCKLYSKWDCKGSLIF